MVTQRTRQRLNRRRFIQALMRVRWPFVLLGCLALLFWPVLLFGTKLKFDPAHFIEIWLHVASEAIIVVFVVEFVQDRRREHDSLIAIADLIEETVLPDLVQVSSLLAGTTSTAQRPDDKVLTRIHAAVEKLRGLEVPLRVVMELAHKSPLQIQGERLGHLVDLERWVRTLSDLQAEHRWYDADKRDLAFLMRELSVAEQAMRAFADHSRSGT